ncbi:MAG TPA: hypothetical protein PL180_07980 [Spirochaetota bacterium]|nr:hypothetical protein [Spirochaetota bacterium]
MFDIREYFDFDNTVRDIRRDIVDIDDDIAYDINTLISGRFDSLYRRDRYKHNDAVIEIIYPALQFPGNNNFILNPDRVRYLLSFYPNKSDFHNIDKIVIRPRFIEVGNIELVSLYLRRKKILVLYLFHPHFYRMRYPRFDDRERAGDHTTEDVLKDRLTDNTIVKDDSEEVYVHPLWYLLSIVAHGNDDRIDKFFIKKDALNDRIYEIMNDISFYYSRHGY